MTTFKLILVHDRYDINRSTRIRCLLLHGNWCCSKRQVIDASRRARVMPGSSLVCDYPEKIYVYGHDNRACDVIEGVNHGKVL